jgi:outer membrane protein TolC
MWRRALNVKARKIFQRIDMQLRRIQLTAGVLIPLSLSILLSGLPGLASASEGGYPEGSPDVTAESKVVLGDDATLQDYLAYAALNNPGLEAAFEEWAQAMERIGQVKSLPDPRLTYAYYIQEVETRVGPQRQAFALMQTIPWFGKLGARGDMAREAAEAAHQKYEAAKLRLFYRVKHAYYEYYYLARAIDITESNMTLLENLESVARAKYRAGEGAHPAVIKAQVELGKLEDRLNSLRDLRAPTLARLNAALGRPAAEDLSWPQGIEYEPVRLDEAEISRRLEETSPELRALAHVTAREERSVNLARKDYFPDFTLGANYIDTGQALDPEMKDSGKDAFMVSLSINLPLWVGKYRSAEREAHARVDAARRRQDDSESRLQADLSFALFQLRDAGRRIDLYRDTLIPKAEESLLVSQRAFAVDNADFFELIDAERTLLEFQLSYERALTEHAQRLSEIEMLTGREL